MQMPANDSPFEDMDERTSAGRLGMVIFLASLAMFFLAGIFAYVVIRLGDADSWPPPGMPDLPRILLFSTFAIVLSSGSLSMAQRAVRVGSEQLVGYWMIWTYILAIVFLVLQAIAWVQMIDAQADITRHLYAWSFYVLTGIHAAHVIGGIIPLTIVVWKSVGGRYTQADHRGLTYIAMYWHFLDVAWLALYATLAWGSSSP